MGNDDKFFLWINRDDNKLQGAAALRPLLERLEASFLPRPTVLGAGGKARRINGYLDPAVLKALDRRKDALRLSNPDAGLDVVIWQVPNRTAITVFFRVETSASTDELRRLFRELVAIVSPSYATLYPSRAGRALDEEVYQFQRRTFYANGLYWLNFFGPEEEARQGGPALAANPLARADRLPYGLLLEVGEGPLDITTPEGRQRLVDATNAMPALDAPDAPAKGSS